MTFTTSEHMVFRITGTIKLRILAIPFVWNPLFVDNLRHNKDTYHFKEGMQSYDLGQSDQS
jgi:hypothetical protein